MNEPIVPKFTIQHGEIINALDFLEGLYGLLGINTMIDREDLKKKSLKVSMCFKTPGGLFLEIIKDVPKEEVVKLTIV